MPHNAIALPADLERRVRDIAAAIGSNPADVMITAIEEYVADLEDLKIAEERIAAYEASETDAVSLEELLAKYGLAN